MIGTMGTTMLGLTVGCARCHDHKYDPIPTRDYYRLASTFGRAVRTEIDYDPDPEGYRAAQANGKKITRRSWPRAAATSASTSPSLSGSGCKALLFKKPPSTRLTRMPSPAKIRGRFSTSRVTNPKMGRPLKNWSMGRF